MVMSLNSLGWHQLAGRGIESPVAAIMAIKVAVIGFGGDVVASRGGCFGANRKNQRGQEKSKGSGLLDASDCTKEA